ncbi:hypothetical protein TrVGV298_002415 [Trichoderma virens]|nr:hypothetical protein TrVGV298_002415 [Trichoderma virens]
MFAGREWKYRAQCPTPQDAFDLRCTHASSASASKGVVTECYPNAHCAPGLIDLVNIHLGLCQLHHKLSRHRASCQISL